LRPVAAAARRGWRFGVSCDSGDRGRVLVRDDPDLRLFVLARFPVCWSSVCAPAWRLVELRSAAFLVWFLPVLRPAVFAPVLFRGAVFARGFGLSSEVERTRALPATALDVRVSPTWPRFASEGDRPAADCDSRLTLVRRVEVSCSFEGGAVSEPARCFWGCCLFLPSVTFFCGMTHSPCGEAWPHSFRPSATITHFETRWRVKSRDFAADATRSGGTGLGEGWRRPG
jgi:hypothetical protein